MVENMAQPSDGNLQFPTNQAPAAITLLAGSMVISVGVVRSMIKRRRQVPAIPAGVPDSSLISGPQNIRTPFPIIPAIPPTPGSAPGDDIDDALARSPFPYSRNNSPLPWLPEIVG